MESLFIMRDSELIYLYQEEPDILEGLISELTIEQLADVFVEKDFLQAFILEKTDPISLYRQIEEDEESTYPYKDDYNYDMYDYHKACVAHLKQYGDAKSVIEDYFRRNLQMYPEKLYNAELRDILEITPKEAGDILGIAPEQVVKNALKSGITEGDIARTEARENQEKTPEEVQQGEQE